MPMAIIEPFQSLSNPTTPTPTAELVEKLNDIGFFDDALDALTYAVHYDHHLYRNHFSSPTKQIPEEQVQQELSQVLLIGQKLTARLQENGIEFKPRVNLRILGDNPSIPQMAFEFLPFSEADIPGGNWEQLMSTFIVNGTEVYMTMETLLTSPVTEASTTFGLNGKDEPSYKVRIIRQQPFVR